MKYKEYLKLKPQIKISNVNQAICLNLEDFPKLIYCVLKKRIKQIINYQKETQNHENATISIIAELQNTINRFTNNNNLNTNTEQMMANDESLNSSPTSESLFTSNSNIDNTNQIFSELDLDTYSEESFETNYYHQTKTAYHKLSKQNILSIIRTDIFGIYNINWENFSMFKNKYNIAETYAEMTKIIKKFGPKIKINERVLRIYIF